MIHLNSSQNPTELVVVAKHNGYSPQLGIMEFQALCETYSIEIIDRKPLKNPQLVLYQIKWDSKAITVKQSPKAE